MKQFLKKLFFKANGEFRTAPLLAWFTVLTLIGIFALAPEIGYGFSHRFFRAGIFQILGPAAGVFLAYKGNQVYQRTHNGNTMMKYVGVGVLLFWSGLFGSAVALKSDRSSNIPDVAIYWANGKVKNATDASRVDYYFKHVTLSETDSLYVVQYGEEPGYNKTNSAVRNGSYPKSDAPRADEDWKRPATKQGKKFEEGKRSF